MIHFNIPPVYGTEEEKIHQVIQNRKICGDGAFTKLCNEWIEKKTSCAKALLTTSCTHALEMAALLCRINPGDEVIMSSYTLCQPRMPSCCGGPRSYLWISGLIR